MTPPFPSQMTTSLPDEPFGTDELGSELDPDNAEATIFEMSLDHAAADVPSAPLDAVTVVLCTTITARSRGWEAPTATPA